MSRPARSSASTRRTHVADGSRKPSCLRSPDETETGEIHQCPPRIRWAAIRRRRRSDRPSSTSACCAPSPTNSPSERITIEDAAKRLVEEGKATVRADWIQSARFQSAEAVPFACDVHVEVSDPIGRRVIETSEAADAAARLMAARFACSGSADRLVRLRTSIIRSRVHSSREDG